MTVCPKCGYRNAEDPEFCTSCGAFLEWSREKKPAEPPTRSPPPRSAPPKNAAPRPWQPKQAPPTPTPPRGSSTGGGNKVRRVVGAPTRSPGGTPPRPGAPRANSPSSSSARLTRGSRVEPSPDRRAAPAAPPPRAAAPAPQEPSEPAPPSAPPVREIDPRAKALVTRPTATIPSGPTRAAPPQASRTAPPAGERRPEARQPSGTPPPRRRPPPKSPAPRQEAAPGDVICTKCGQPNEPGRRFCHQCGKSLVAKAAPVREAPPWWKTLFRRSPATYTAGQRRTRSDGTRNDGSSQRAARAKKTLRVVAVIAAVFLMIALAGPWRPSVNRRVSGATRAVKNVFVTSYEPVHAQGADATTAIADHPATNAIDGAINTAWQEADAGDGENQKLVLTFESQVDVDRIGIHSGVSENPDEFLAQPRPRELRLAFSDGTSKDIRLKDSPGFQTFKVKARDVISVEITIISVYTSFRGGHDAGIAEVELFTRS